MSPPVREPGRAQRRAELVEWLSKYAPWLPAGIADCVAGIACGIPNARNAEGQAGEHPPGLLTASYKTSGDGEGRCLSTTTTTSTVFHPANPAKNCGTCGARRSEDHRHFFCD